LCPPAGRRRAHAIAFGGLHFSACSRSAGQAERITPLRRKNMVTVATAYSCVYLSSRHRRWCVSGGVRPAGTIWTILKILLILSDCFY